MDMDMKETARVGCGRCGSLLLHAGGKDLLAVCDQRGEHEDLLREISHMLGRGNECGRKYSCQIVLIHLVDGIVRSNAAKGRKMAMKEL